ncbi:MAG: 1-acyl-sn-glycerol-3-phosphate acyltransferase [Propionibacteriaceae bacterium]|nr:1-acyl-sn-glycerol-3-phosphate acyltransferase [Propionibacteriaceae bacterium]
MTESQRRRRVWRLSAVNPHPADPVYRLAAWGVHLGLGLFGHRRWSDQDKLPAEGPVIVCPNHVSRFDPVAVGDYLIWSGRWPRFMAKVELDRHRLSRWIFQASGCIPVDRGSLRAVDSLEPARVALEQGDCVVVYPEGSETWDPDLWPMAGRTGAARLALATGAPVVPMGQWGSHRVYPPHRLRRVQFGRVPFQAALGDPVDLSDLRSEQPDHDSLAVATDRIMDAITALVATLRQEPAPDQRYDRRARRRLPPRSEDRSD